MNDLLTLIGQMSVSTRISPNDQMYSPGNEQHYFYVGRSNILTLLNVLNIRKAYPGGNAPVRDIYDFGCGHGRVTRWLRVAFPEADLHVTDFDKTGADFCVANFGCIDTSGEVPANAFDLVWLGSVFTHLPEAIAERLLETLTRALRPNGVLVFTSQGRFAIERMKNFDWQHDRRTWLHYELSKPSFETVARRYGETGYGYIDYPNQVDYGVCIARPEWYSGRVLRGCDFTQILFQEKGADNHQDVSAFMRANILDETKGPLW